jgi:hypothetical protein
MLESSGEQGLSQRQGGLRGGPALQASLSVPGAWQEVWCVEAPGAHHRKSSPTSNPTHSRSSCISHLATVRKADRGCRGESRATFSEGPRTGQATTQAAFLTCTCRLLYVTCTSTSWVNSHPVGPDAEDPRPSVWHCGR